ncbi:MAG: DoxX family protein [Balneolaceae bacterium]|nr:DoxX family protein [Balneolaceae bacterium]
MFKKLLSKNIDTIVPIDVSLLILRVAIGGSMLTHGWPKLMKVFSGNLSFGDPIGLGPEISLVLAAFAEAICSILVIAGLGTRLATIPLVFTMAVAVFVAHADDPFGTKEKAFMFMIVFLFLFFAGGGKYSADSWFRKK